MRYVLFLCLLVVTLPVLGRNEVVSAISYNPSRLGSYTHLRAVEKLELKGGLFVGNSATVNVVNTVKITEANNNYKRCESGTCGSISYIQPIRQGLEENNCKQISDYCGWQTNASGGVLQGSAGTLYGNGTHYTGTSASGNMGLTVHMNGGTLRATDSSSGHYSFLSGISEISGLELRGSSATLQVNGTVEATDGYELGGVSIGKGQLPSNPTYNFVPRVDKDGKRWNILSAS